MTSECVKICPVLGRSGVKASARVDDVESECGEQQLCRQKLQKQESGQSPSRKSVVKYANE